MSETSTTMRWKKTGTAYESECGRFAIHNTSLTTRACWVLFDRLRKDPLFTEYTWTRHCCTLASAKAQAGRISRNSGKRS